MKNSEAKKPGLLSSLKAILSEAENEAYKQDRRLAKERAHSTCRQLSYWDVNANVVEEEGTTVTIEIAGSPIHWIDVSHFHDPTEDFKKDYLYEFIAPDPRSLVKLGIWADPVRKWGWITGGSWITGDNGKLIDIRWKGSDGGTGISRDQEIKAIVMSLIADPDGTNLYILTRPEIGCWVIKPTQQYFRREHWNTFERIAKRLLMASLPM
jgi:hypothetical protein